MVRADVQVRLLINFFSASFQLKSLERRLVKDLNLKDQFSPTILDDLTIGYIVGVENFIF